MYFGEGRCAVSMLVEARDVSFGYKKDQKILDHVNFTMDEGERVALVGPSGCGKSTLVKILSGYLKPQGGEVLFDGKSLPQTGYCPVQLIYQHPEKAVNPRWKLGRTLTEGWKPDEEMIARMGIEPQWMSRYPAELSGGELQRFCIARAMGPETRCVIADEMTVMLDVITQAQIWEVVLGIVEKRNMGLLVVTHSMKLAERICTRIVQLGTGEI